MKKILDNLRSILIIVRDVFPYVLLIYLIFFLLENLFPGFVSNNFDLNIVLIVVLILGLLSAFSPTPKEVEEPVNKTDYIMVGFLFFLAFIILWYKTKEMGIAGFVIALGGSALVVMISLVLLLMPDELPAEQDKDEGRKEIINKNSLIKIRHVAQIALFRGVKIPLLLILLVVVIIYFFFNRNQSQNIVKQTLTPTPLVSEPTPTVVFEETIPPSSLPSPEVKTLKGVSVIVLNGSPKVGSASAMAKLLRAKNFVVDKVADADSSGYENATVRFRPEDVAIAEYLIETIQSIYPAVEKVPLATDGAQIILILGKP